GQRAHHAQCVERELLEKLARPVRIRTIHRSRATARTTLGRVRNEWRAAWTCLVDKSRCRLHLRQRLDAAARPRLDLIDVAVEVVIGTSTRAQARRSHC